MTLSRLARSSAALAVFLSLPASAAEVDATAKYIMSLGGINIAAMTVDLADSGSHYRLDLSANVAGLGTLVASGTAKATSEGRSSGSALQ